MRDNELEWSQFCRLGEMIGDGLHHEEPWISKEYKRLSKILLPETEEEKKYKREIKQLRNQNINNQINEKLKIDACIFCGSSLKQIRSGSKTVVCTNSNCGKKFKYKSKKK